MRDMHYETGWQPLNRQFVVVGSMYTGKPTTKVEVFESDSSLLADMVYGQMRDYFTNLVEHMHDDGMRAYFRLEFFVRSATVPPGNAMSFSGDGQLVSFEPNHSDCQRFVDSRSWTFYVR